MSWASVYRMALHLLPARLHRKHGHAIEELFTRELAQARTQGWLQTALVGAGGVWDVIRRAVYEQARVGRGITMDLRDSPSQKRGPFDEPSSRLAPTNFGETYVPQPTGHLLRRGYVTSFATAFSALTVLLVASFARKQLPALNAAGATHGNLAEVLLLAVPFTAALTIPMSVFVAVLWEFTRLGAEGALAAARRKRGGMSRLILPVLAAATGVAVISFVVTAEIVPRANRRLLTVLAQRASGPSDRAMTLGELRAAAREARTAPARSDLMRMAGYEMEIQKKFALPAACVVLALVAIGVALIAPRGGAALVIAASLAVFSAYYVMFVTGESLAHQLVISPAVAMWGANALLLTAALLAVSRRAGSVA